MKNLRFGLLFLWLISLVPLFFIHVHPQVAIVLMFGLITLVVFRTRALNKVDAYSAFLIALAVLEALWIALLPWRPLFSFVQISLTVLTLLAFFAKPKLQDGVAQRRPKSGIIAGVAVLAVSLISLVPHAFFVAPNATLSLMADENYTQAEESTSTLDNGAIYFKNVQYGSEYPRSFLDIYQAPNAAADAPTYFYIHGGGYVFGDKAYGDPAGGGQTMEEYFKTFTDKGYNVVAINYAFAPESEYPTPVLQATQALQFLQDHAQDYKLNMDRVVLGGGSAGGQIALQLVGIQTNETYADLHGFEQVLEPSAIKALVLESALIDPTRFNHTGFFMSDILFDAMKRSYFGEQFLATSHASEASVLGFTNLDFPPTYIDDAGQMSFSDQAENFASLLESNHVPYELNIYPNSTHSFERQDTDDARDNAVKMWTFLDQHV